MTRERVEQVVLPHLDAAYNLAHYLTGNPTDAEDVVQEACLRAIRAFDGYHGGMSSARSWMLTIVRNTTYTWLRTNRKYAPATGMDEEMENVAADAPDPEQILMQSVDAQMLADAVQQLPVEYREVLVLRELEVMSYKEIADICGLPLGTVMSRLARARKQMQQLLGGKVRGGVA
jgi:RNA polymerase sigma-70 factor (ECF subfamily)